AGRSGPHGAEIQRPSARCSAQAPALASGWFGAQLQIEASTRPSCGWNWSKPKRLTPQSTIEVTWAGVSALASWSAGVALGSTAAGRQVPSSEQRKGVVAQELW